MRSLAVCCGRHGGAGRLRAGLGSVCLSSCERRVGHGRCGGQHTALGAPRVRDGEKGAVDGAALERRVPVVIPDREELASPGSERRAESHLRALPGRAHGASHAATTTGHSSLNFLSQDISSPNVFCGWMLRGIYSDSSCSYWK